MIKEISRIIISVGLLVAAVLLLYWGLNAQAAAQALGIGAIAGAIISALVVYWLKG